MTGEMSLNDALLMLNSISRDRYKGKKALKFIYKAYVPIQGLHGGKMGQIWGANLPILQKVWFYFLYHNIPDQICSSNRLDNYIRVFEYHKTPKLSSIGKKGKICGQESSILGLLLQKLSIAHQILAYIHQKEKLSAYVSQNEQLRLKKFDFAQQQHFGLVNTNTQGTKKLKFRRKNCQFWGWC